MEVTFTLARITLYPIKSFDGISVAAAEVLPSGALAHDRRYALRDGQGEWINGKTNALVHLLRAGFSDDLSEVRLRDTRNQRQAVFRLDTDRSALEAWLSDFFDQRVMITENPRAGFPDDTDSPGPTVVSRQTFDEVSKWYPGISVDNVRGRFRANLEVDGDAPFCEDRLAADTRHVVRFAIGPVEFEGVNPCQRCIVPTRDPLTAAMYPRFAKEFALHRQAGLPAWSAPERFDHFYRLSTNTRLSPRSNGGTIRVGDQLRVIELVPA